MRGAKGSKTELTIIRSGQTKPLVFNLVRDVIKVKSVRGEILAEQFIYCHVLHSSKLKPAKSLLTPTHAWPQKQPQRRYFRFAQQPRRGITSIGCRSRYVYGWRPRGLYPKAASRKVTRNFCAT